MPSIMCAQSAKRKASTVPTSLAKGTCNPVNRLSQGEQLRRLAQTSWNGASRFLISPLNRALSPLRSRADSVECCSQRPRLYGARICVARVVSSARSSLALRDAGKGPCQTCTRGRALGLGRNDSQVMGITCIAECASEVGGYLRLLAYRNDLGLVPCRCAVLAAGVVQLSSHR